MNSGGIVALRYAKEIHAIAGCPPSEALPRATIGFRFVTKDLADVQNFKPVALLQPSRAVGPLSITHCCCGYALSMFQSMKHLRPKAQAMQKSAPLFLKRVGDHYAKIDIQPMDGTCTLPNSSGHFAFFESKGFVGVLAVKEHGVLQL